jgi:hypothetical protein
MFAQFEPVLPLRNFRFPSEILEFPSISFFWIKNFLLHFLTFPLSETNNITVDQRSFLPQLCFTTRKTRQNVWITRMRNISWWQSVGEFHSMKLTSLRKTLNIFEENSRNHSGCASIWLINRLMHNPEPGFVHSHSNKFPFSLAQHRFRSLVSWITIPFGFGAQVNISIFQVIKWQKSETILTLQTQKDGHWT